MTHHRAGAHSVKGADFLVVVAQLPREAYPTLHQELQARFFIAEQQQLLEVVRSELLPTVFEDRQHAEADLVGEGHECVLEQRGAA